MNRVRIGLLLCVAVLALPRPAAAGLADQVGVTFASMVGEFVKAFPAMEGRVVAVEGDHLSVNLSEKDGLRKGQELVVFRKGEVFRHPITLHPLGRYEEQLGYAKVQQVFPDRSEAQFIPLDGKPEARAGGAGVRPEDGVRITRGRIRLAVAPVLDLTRSGADLRRVPYLLAVSLERTKRFQVADPQRVADMFATERVPVEILYMKPERFVQLGRAAEVEGWLVPVLLERAGTRYLDVAWISAITGTALFSARRVLARPAPAEEQRFPWEPRAGD